MDRISKLPKMDRISNIPPSIIETILCLLPIQEAARTSILARGWRYHWTKIPKLAFIEDTFQVPADEAELLVQTYDRTTSLRKEMSERCKLFYAIYQVLLMHEGPIREFTLSMTANKSCVEIDHILHYLSKKKTIKKLTLDICWGYKLPLSLFSMHQLTDLYLNSCCLDYQPKFDGFGSLTSLCVQELEATEKSLMHLLSKCPLLKNLGLYSSCTTISYSDEYDSSIADLFECMPMIENLSIWFHIVLCFVKERVPKQLPTALVHLKYLFMKSLSFMHKYGLPFLALLIRSSPKLEILKLEFLDENAWLDEFEIGPIAIEDYSDIWLEHLNELEMINFGNREYELDFVKLILAKSPVLKKVRIFLYKDVDEDGELKIKEILLRSPRASPTVEIIVQDMETRRDIWCFLTLVKFRMIIFRPYVGEIVSAKLKESISNGLRLTLGFFDDIYIPELLMPEPSRCKPDADHKNQVIWAWFFNDEEYFIDGQDEIRFRVQNVKFPEIPKEQIGTKPFAPMEITGSLVSDGGLGLVSWWV